MSIKDFYEDKTAIQSRLPLLQLIIVIIFFFLSAGLWKLQLIQRDYYSKIAERNRTRSISWPAPRGNILDRNGRVLVDNKPSFTLTVMRDHLATVIPSFDLLERGLKLEPNFLKSQIEKQSDRPYYLPIVLKENIEIEDISFVESHRSELPSLEIIPHPTRRYYENQVAAHLLGYVSEISKKQLNSEEFKEYVKAGDMIGKKGVERVYNRILTGIDGQKKVLVDSRGREIKVLEIIEPEPGTNLRLTIDIDIQRAAEKAFGNMAGAAVALDPQTGEVLCLVSRPAFDPTIFSARISRKEWTDLLLDPRKPLHNRATQSGFSPGSVFKIFMAVAGLQEGILTSNSIEVCKGSTVLYGQRFNCWKKEGHGKINLHRAIVNSCNVFFYHLGRRLGIEKIAHYSKAMGLGKRTGIDLLDEEEGLVPSPAWKKRTHASNWYPGETISVSIGQGYLSATPMQLARSFGGLALKGPTPVPHVVLASELPKIGRSLPAPLKQSPPFNPKFVKIISRGLWGVVNEYGTGRRAAVKGFDVCGKTGTAQVVSRETQLRNESDKKFEDNAWFVGFAPRDFPEITAAVFVEQGGHGGTSAAPIIREMFQVYFDKHKTLHSEN